MRNSLVALLSLAFAFALGTAQAAGEGKKADPVAAACKGKKAGDTVSVDGKDVQCPDKKKKKDEKK